MHETLERNASGIQIAFLVFAIVFLSYPAQKYVGPFIGLEPGSNRIWGRLFIFVPALVLLFGIPSLRRFCLEQLSRPIGRRGRIEVSLVTIAQAWVPFAFGGAIVLWYWIKGGEMALARRIGNETRIEEQLAQSLSLEGVVFAVLLTAFIAPIVEELVFRGFLCRAWEKQWGWFWSMIATSALFAIYHPVPLTAFVGAIIFTVVLRRTGSIRAPIIVHAVGNLMLWPPLMGQFYFRTAGKSTGEIELWSFHLASLAVLAVALPLYVWFGRNEKPADER